MMIITTFQCLAPWQYSMTVFWQFFKCRQQWIWCSKVETTILNSCKTVQQVFIEMSGKQTVKARYRQRQTSNMCSNNNAAGKWWLAMSLSFSTLSHLSSPPPLSGSPLSLESRFSFLSPSSSHWTKCCPVVTTTLWLVSLKQLNSIAITTACCYQTLSWHCLE